MSKWFDANELLESSLVLQDEGRVVSWDFDLVSPAMDGYSTCWRLLESSFASRAAKLHLPNYQNFKKLPKAIRTDGVPPASMNQMSDLQPH